MASFIYENRNSLAERHYVRQAKSGRYWFDFYSKKLEAYRKRYGENFCLIIVGSEITDDAYIIPYRAAQRVFVPEALDHRRRWIGTVEKDLIHITGRRVLPVAAFYNAFDLLDDAVDIGREDPDEALDVPGDRIRLPDLTQRIADFNAKYREVAPYRRLVLSRRIARPGAITDYLKEFRNHQCQLCKALPFQRKNGDPYCEAHHIIELHHLIPGSYCSDNIIVVCPTCRKKLQYAAVEYEVLAEGSVRVQIGDAEYEFDRNILSGDGLPT
jgi:hypothetical protein